jgi:hypothetical protein
VDNYVFLSVEWVAAAEALKDQHSDSIGEPPVSITLNVHITETPFGDDVKGHIDSTDGLKIERGALAGADVDLTLTYETAFELFSLRDPQVAMTAFLSGKVRAEGDVAKLLAIQAQPPTPDGVDTLRIVFAEIIAFTEGVE